LALFNHQLDRSVRSDRILVVTTLIVFLVHVPLLSFNHLKQDVWSYCDNCLSRTVAQ
jgi:hypothetical protein